MKYRCVSCGKIWESRGAMSTNCPTCKSTNILMEQKSEIDELFDELEEQ